MGRFRVKRCGFSSFYNRRLRRPGDTGVSLDSEDEGHELLAAATKLEVDGRVRDAFTAYQYVAQKYPQTSAGRDAQISLEGLRAKIKD